MVGYPTKKSIVGYPTEKIIGRLGRPEKIIGRLRRPDACFFLNLLYLGVS